MKKLSILFILVFIASGCATEEEKTYTTTVGIYTPYVMFPETLQGQVKSIYETNYFAEEVDGEIIQGDRLTIEARDTIKWTKDFKVMYNELGLVTMSKILDENDKVLYYDETIIEEDKIVQANEFKDDTLRVKNHIMYDENNHMKKIKRMRMPEDTLINKIEMKCDSTGLLIAFKFINADGEKGYAYKYTFDETGVNTGYIVKNPEGEQTLECTLERNEKGFLTMSKFSSEKSESITHYTYEAHDDMGNWTKCVAKGDDGKIIIEERAITYYGDEE